MHRITDADKFGDVPESRHCAIIHPLLPTTVPGAAEQP